MTFTSVLCIVRRWWNRTIYDKDGAPRNATSGDFCKREYALCISETADKHWSFCKWILNQSAVQIIITTCQTVFQNENEQNSHFSQFYQITGIHITKSEDENVWFLDALSLLLLLMSFVTTYLFIRFYAHSVYNIKCNIFFHFDYIVLCMAHLFHALNISCY